MTSRKIIWSDKTINSILAKGGCTVGQHTKCRIGKGPHNKCCLKWLNLYGNETKVERAKLKYAACKKYIITISNAKVVKGEK